MTAIEAYLGRLRSGSYIEGTASLVEKARRGFVAWIKSERRFFADSIVKRWIMGDTTISDKEAMGEEIVKEKPTPVSREVLDAMQGLPSYNTVSSSTSENKIGFGQKIADLFSNINDDLLVNSFYRIIGKPCGVNRLTHSGKSIPLAKGVENEMSFELLANAMPKYSNPPVQEESVIDRSGDIVANEPYKNAQTKMAMLSGGFNYEISKLDGGNILMRLAPSELENKVETGNSVPNLEKKYISDERRQYLEDKIISTYFDSKNKVSKLSRTVSLFKANGKKYNLTDEDKEYIVGRLNEQINGIGERSSDLYSKEISAMKRAIGYMQTKKTYSLSVLNKEAA